MKCNQIAEIIPPADYQHRNGFNNIPLINKLNYDEKKQLEDDLIELLLDSSKAEVDTLIVETLAYLKSERALPVLKNLLKNCNNEMTKLAIATSIFIINSEPAMVDIAISCLERIDNNKDSYYVYKLTTAFYDLVKFNNLKINDILKKYVTHKEYLVSYNAKRALSLE